MRITKRQSAAAWNAFAPPGMEKDVPKARAKRTYPEAELQQACVRHYRERCRLDRTLRENTRLFAIAPHDGKKTPWQRDFCKRMGQIAGPHDIQFIDKRSGFAYHWIELKSSVGRLSDEQEDFMRFLDGTPVQTHVVRTLDEFVAILG